MGDFYKTNDFERDVIRMKLTMKKILFGTAVSMLMVICLVGCESTPPPTPVSQRKAGEDISPESRKDKQGDVTVPSGK